MNRVQHEINHNYDQLSLKVKDQLTDYFEADDEELFFNGDRITNLALVQSYSRSWMTYLKGSFMQAGWRDSLKDAAKAKAKEELQKNLDEQKAKLDDHETQVSVISGYLNDHLSEEQKETLAEKKQSLDGIIAVEEMM